MRCCGVKNFYPAISIEGFEEATDFRRGRVLTGYYAGDEDSERKEAAFRRIWVLYQQEHRLHQLG